MKPVRHPDAPAPGELLGAHYEQCFGCGGEQPHGLHLAARAGEGVTITAEFTVRAAHQGAPGLAHGGVLAARRKGDALELARLELPRALCFEVWACSEIGRAHV